MGGSGGWYNWGKPPDVDKLLNQMHSNEQRAQYEVEINQYLLDLLSNYNDRKVEEIQQHLDTIKRALDKDIEGAVDLIFGGSISKHTYVNGLSDIDMLVRINNTSLTNASPAQVKEYFAERLRRRLPNTEIRVGALAVTVRFSSTGHEIQLLPALSTKTGVKIARADGNGWSNVVKPARFAEKLTEANRLCNQKLVPVIKLFKGLNESLSEKVRLSGYHIEALAIKAFDTYSGRMTYKDMLLHLCRQAPKLVLSPMSDSTGQSVHVDEYLGGANNLLRQQCSAALERLANRLSNADRLMNIDQWKGIFT
ncbi:MAG: nucleotidyltransferase [Firmicutes bacterium]|nr:nucleotidyltransferase [Bacillota bacterium]